MTNAVPDSIFKGLALRLLAALCLATMAMLIKLAEARGATLPEAMFFRQTCALPIVIAFVARTAGLGSIRTRHFGAHVVRTVVGLMGMVATFGTVLLLPLAEATTFQFTSPIFATILGATVLREKTGWHRWSAVIVGFLGVVIVAQPGSGHFPAVGALVGLTAALFIAIVAILLRQIGKTERPGTTVFWFSALSVPVLGVAWALNYQPHDTTTWAILVGIGLVGGTAQLALTGALRYAPVSLAVPMDYSALIWASLYGVLVFGMLPTPGVWIGAPIIIASGLYIAWREHRLLGARQAP